MFIESPQLILQVLKKVDREFIALSLMGLVGFLSIIFGISVLSGSPSQIRSLVSGSEIEAFGGSKEVDFIDSTNSDTGDLDLGKIQVDISGAVESPGIYELPLGSRAAQAIELAGGFSLEADAVFISQNLNLAQTLSDEQKLYVPFVGEHSSSGGGVASNGQSGPDSQGEDLISVNFATAKELETLPGIGEVRAQKIIENRPYLDLEELVVKKVVTQNQYDEIKKSLTL